MKGMFNLRPPKARYSHTSDVTMVLDYLRTLGPNEGLSLKNITMKLVVLAALTSGQRCQSLSLMNINSVQIGTNYVKFVIEELTKTSQVGKPRTEVNVIAYPHDHLLCVTSVLKVYLQKTKKFRSSEKKLFLSYVPPQWDRIR